MGGALRPSKASQIAQTRPATLFASILAPQTIQKFTPFARIGIEKSSIFPELARYVDFGNYRPEVFRLRRDASAAACLKINWFINVGSQACVEHVASSLHAQMPDLILILIIILILYSSFSSLES